MQPVTTRRLPVAAPLVEGEHGVDRLLAGRLDERARVDDDEVGRLGVVGRAQPVGEQRADQLVGVDLVLRATKRLDVEASRTRLTRLLTGATAAR